MSLREYQRKRDFSKTAEPPAKTEKKRRKQLRFVIQKHDASRLHYDFRLELDGTLKSWAVPKGPPFAHAEKRLAVQVEDHPIDYATFEGIIPAGQYGGGTVMVWDEGTWEPLGGKPETDLDEGKLHFALHGTKLDGEWTLVRTRGEESHDWLLIKSGKAMRPVSKKKDDESVISGRTLRQIAAAHDAEWQSNRSSPPAKSSLKERVRARAGGEAKAVKPATQKSGGSGTKPKFVEPMKAKLASAPPSDGDWIWELKFDGFRALAIKDGSHVELLSRNGKDLGKKFPALVEAVAQIEAERAVLDGEIVALDDAGRSSFQLLQAYEFGEERPPLCFYLFDLLHHDGHDLSGLPLAERKEKLEPLVHDAAGLLRFSANIKGDPKKLLAQVKARGLEGIIGKRIGSAYEIGKRSGAWIKLKCVNEQEFVIGGYTPPQGTRQHFGALLVGFFEEKQLKFAGKVGTGFSAALLREMHARFTKLRVANCPFANLPEKAGGRWSQNITPGEMKRCTWLKPTSVCQVKFTEWTFDGKLRHPVFLGLREDKTAREVVREKPAKT